VTSLDECVHIGLNRMATLQVLVYQRDALQMPTTANDPISSERETYTCVSAIRSPAFVIGSTRNLRRNYGQDVKNVAGARRKQKRKASSVGPDGNGDPHKKKAKQVLASSASSARPALPVPPAVSHAPLPVRASVTPPRAPASLETPMETASSDSEPPTSRIDPSSSISAPLAAAPLAIEDRVDYQQLPEEGVLLTLPGATRSASGGGVPLAADRATASVEPETLVATASSAENYDRVRGVREAEAARDAKAQKE
jgi:hypothetical protein